MNQTTVSDIPVIWLDPKRAEVNKLVIWLPGFSGTKEAMEPYLTDLAAAGFVALSFDPVEHGERRIEAQEALVARIRGNIRRYFWPILARTAEETPTIIDWAIDHLGVDEQVGMGGISMGGDISVTATAVDPRITVVAAGIATPDWLRPGSFEPPGEPDDSARTFYDRCNPLTHLDAYQHCPAISFQCGAEDQQVPPDGAIRFIEALRRTHYATVPNRLEATLHKDVAHAFPEESWGNCVWWFQKHLGSL